MKRRIFLAGATGALASGVGIAPSSFAQERYPAQTIRVVVGAAPGATTDFAGRLVADILSQNLGTAIITNQPGANGTIAARNVIRATPDGYTVLFYYSDQMQVAPLVYKPAYDPIGDFTHITTAVRSGGFILAVPANSPAKTFAEFIDYAKSGKKAMSYGTYGVGSSVQLGFEVLNERYGLNMTHIPYKGGAPSYQAAVAGEIDIVAGTSFVQLLRAGRLRPLAIGGSQRSAEFTTLPSLGELGLSESLFGPVFYGLAAPKGTPSEVVAMIRAVVAKGAQMPDFASKLNNSAHEPFVIDAVQTVALIQKGLDTYRPVVQRLGITIE